MFVREATGLVKDMGLRDVILFNSVAQGIGIGAISFVIPVYLGLIPNAEFLLGAGLSILAGVLITIVYAYFLAAMPRSGGEYVFLSRVAHPFVGFFFSASMISLWLLAFGLNLGFSASLFVPLIGQFATIPAFWTSTNGTFIVSVFFGLITFLIAVFGLRVYLRYQLVVAVLSVIASLAFIAAFATIGSPSNFVSVFNKFATQYYPGVASPYDYILTTAQKAGYTGQTSVDFGQTLGLMVVFGFSGLLTAATFSSYVAGEVKQAQSGKRQIYGLTGGLLLNGILLVILSIVLLGAVGSKWIGSFYYLSVNQASAIQLPTTLLAFPFNLMGWLTNPVSATIILVASILLGITWATQDLIAVSRVFFAWSFDRLLPAKFSNVSERYGTPTIGVTITFLLGVIITGLAVYTQYFAFLSAAGWLVYSTFAAVGLTAILFPYLKKDLYEQMPMKGKVGGVPVLQLVGLATLIMYGVMASIYVWGPAYASTIGVWNSVTSSILIGVYVVTVAIYVGANQYRKRQGIDLSLNFKTIPPE